MNSWWEDLLDWFDWGKIIFGLAIAGIIYGIYYIIFEASFTTQAVLGVLIAAFIYIIYIESSGDEDEEDDF